jgi:outer membrane protein OmpA-like peptidoglycan-associated protein
VSLNVKKPFAMIAVAFGAIAALAGCGQPGAPASAGTNTRTTCMAAPPAAQTDKPVIAVLADVAAPDQSAALAAQRAEAISRITDAGFAMGARLLVDVIGGGIGDADLVVNTQLDAEGANALVRGNAGRCKREGVAGAVDRLRRRASTSPVDVLDALRRVDGHLTGLTNRRVNVVLLSSLLNATPALPLNDPRTLARDPQSLLNAVERARLLPDCRGWDVYVIGAGRTQTGGIGDQRGAELQAFWTAFFARCGGRIVAYDSELTQFPVSATRARTVAAQPATLARERTAPSAHEAPPRTVTVILADTVLFDDGSATPSAAAETALTEALTRVRRGRTITGISVRGYTDTTPINTPVGNVGLSTRRAQVVLRWLTGHGVSVRKPHAVGFGPADPISANTTAEGRARNRRVEISFTTTAGSQ